MCRTACAKFHDVHYESNKCAGTSPHSYQSKLAFLPQILYSIELVIQHLHWIELLNMRFCERECYRLTQWFPRNL